jgi:hypothetical protein
VLGEVHEVRRVQKDGDHVRVRGGIRCRVRTVDRLVKRELLVRQGAAQGARTEAANEVVATRLVVVAFRVRRATSDDRADERRRGERGPDRGAHRVNRVDVDLLERLVETPVAAVKVLGNGLAAVLGKAFERRFDRRDGRSIAGRPRGEIANGVSVLHHGEPAEGRGRWSRVFVALEVRTRATAAGATATATISGARPALSTRRPRSSADSCAAAPTATMTAAVRARFAAGALNLGRTGQGKGEEWERRQAQPRRRHVHGFV